MSQTYTITVPSQPGLTPPPGVTPYFDSPYTLRPYNILTVTACVSMTTLLVIARMYTKVRILKSVVLEDYACLIGWATFMAFCTLSIAVGNRGVGTHQWNLSMADVEFTLRYSNYIDMIYPWSLAFTKLSILLLILRVFLSVNRDKFYYFTHVLIWLNSLFYSVYFFIPIFLCVPRRKIWIQTAPGHCLKIIECYLASAIFNCVSDISMLAVPIYLIWNLQMSSRRKFGISAIFATGGLACIASIARIVYAVLLSRTEDYTYLKMGGILWAYAEIACGLLCSCLPIIPRLYQDLFSTSPSHTSNTTARKALAERSKGSASVAEDRHGKWVGFDSRRQQKGDWIHLDDRNNPELPPRTTVDVEHRTSEEQAIEDAIEGNVDVEEGFGGKR